MMTFMGARMVIAKNQFFQSFAAAFLISVVSAGYASAQEEAAPASDLSPSPTPSASAEPAPASEPSPTPTPSTAAEPSPSPTPSAAPANVVLETDPNARPSAPAKGVAKLIVKEKASDSVVELIKDLVLDESPSVRVGQELEKDAESASGPQSPTNPVVIIEGVFNRKGWALYYNEETLWLTRDKRFKLEISIFSKETEIELVARGKDGVEEKSKLLIQFNDWNKYSGDPKTRKGVKKDSLWVGGRLGSFGYSEVRANPAQNKDASQIALDLWAFYKRAINPKWNANAAITFVALPITADPSGFRLLNVRAFGTYEFYSTTDLKFQFSAGLKYFTMMTDGSFGFAGATGAQFFPGVTKKLSNGSEIQAYVGYSSVSLYYGLLPSSSNAELIAGISYDLVTAEKGRQIRLHLDFSSLSLDVDDAVIGLSRILIGASTPLY